MGVGLGHQVDCSDDADASTESLQTLEQDDARLQLEAARATASGTTIADEV